MSIPDNMPTRPEAMPAATHMSAAANVYRAYSAVPAEWRIAGGRTVEVASMTDSHCAKVLEQLCARAKSLASLYVWGMAYLDGSNEALPDLATLYAVNPWDVLATTPLVLALQQRTSNKGN